MQKMYLFYIIIAFCSIFFSCSRDINISKISFEDIDSIVRTQYLPETPDMIIFRYHLKDKELLKRKDGLWIDTITYDEQESVKQTKYTKEIAPNIFEEIISPILDKDSFGLRRYFLSGGLIIRDQYFRTNKTDLYKEIIYKYDDFGNLLYKARKSRYSPNVYTYENLSFHDNHMWEKRNVYLNKEFLYQEQQIIFRNKE